MPRRPTKTDLETAIQDAADQFAMQILELVRGATVDELAALTTVTESLAARRPAVARAAPKKRGRPAKAESLAPEAAPKRGRPPKAEKAAAAAEPVKKARKKRVWPKCTTKGCDKNVYMPSGDKKMCYQHYLASGGKPSPLVAYKKQQASGKPATEDAAAKKKPAKKKTVIRKAADKKPAPPKAADKKPAPPKTS